MLVVDAPVRLGIVKVSTESLLLLGGSVPRLQEARHRALIEWRKQTGRRPPLPACLRTPEVFS